MAFAARHLTAIMGFAFALGFPWLAAGAEPDASAKLRCKASYENAQVARRDVKFRDARTQIGICRETCPAPLVHECERWSSELDALMPTVKLDVRDEQNQPISGVRASVDGRVLSSITELVAVDPGTHVFRFEPKVGKPVETKADVTVGERAHVVSVVIESPPPPTLTVSTPQEAARPRGSRVPSYVLGGIGVASLVAAGVLGVKGQLDKSSLKDDCAPNCTDDQVDSIRTIWWAAAGFGALGAVAVGAAVLLWPRAPVSVTPTVGKSSYAASLSFTLD